MFLKLSALITISFASMIATAQVATAEIQAGKYELKTGVDILCNDFSLNEKDLQYKTINIAGQYAFETKNSTHVIESDIDPECEFREQNLRENADGLPLTLTRINEEYCKGKLRSKTVSTVTFAGNTITVQHQVDAAAAYTCIWKKQ